MKKKLMAVLTASSVAVMAAGATLAAYAEPEQEEQIKDEDETYAYGVDSHCLYINKLEGFEKWKDDERIYPDKITTISFDNFYDDLGEIPAGAFEGLTSVENVIFTTAIYEIGDNAFKGCTSLAEITFPPFSSSYMTIGKSAFEGCTSISQLDFTGTSVEVIGESAFEGCTSITQLQFYDPNNSYRMSLVKKIGKSAFKGCTGLMDIYFGKALEEIGESAFEGCVNLGKAESKPNEETNNCDITIWLHEIHFQSNGSDLKIGNRAFYGCEKLTAFRFPKNVMTIGEYAFANCASLYVADMKECTKLESIKEYAFFNCLSLTQVHFPQCDAYYNAKVYDPTIKKHTIAENAFRNCPWLEGVILSPYVDYVAPGAFNNCKNLKYIGYYVSKDQYLGTNIKIVIDTEDSKQDSQGSIWGTVYVPSEVTVFSFEHMDQIGKNALKNEKTDEMFREKLAENDSTLEYDGQVFSTEPEYGVRRNDNPISLFEPTEPKIENTRYESILKGLMWFTPNDESQFAAVYEAYKKDLQLWNDHKSYEEWQAFLNAEGSENVKKLWDEMLESKEYKDFSEDINKKIYYNITLYNEPKSETGEALDIVLPEKFSSDTDIYSITKVNGSVDIVNIPVKGSITDQDGKSHNYYDFSIMESMGYNFTANYLLGWDNNRTFRDASDIDDPKASGIYGTMTGDTQIKRFPINTPPSPGNPSTTTTPGSSSSTTTSPGGNPPPVNTSDPPSPPPTPNTNDPIEPDPGEPESSEPESSEPESSEPESSEPESSTPGSIPDDNPGTGVGACFLAPIVLIGAATIVVAAKRRKMK